MSHDVIGIAELMEESGVKFGTSGARGRVADMTDRVCYLYTRAFLQYLGRRGEMEAGSRVAIAGDYRPSSPRILAAVAMAISDAGHTPVHCGEIPTPAVALYGMQQRIPSIMVTGSHIPDDRNGIKFYKPAGEILKEDEQGICAQQVDITAGRFDAAGMMRRPFVMPARDSEALDLYVRRYVDFLPAECLSGKTIGVYEHSTVARDLLVTLFEVLGAEVIRLGRSEAFIPVDTEAIRSEDVQLAKQWADAYGMDCIVSADGDGDRPLISDEHGNWLRGDVAGIFCAAYLSASHVVTPVSSNSAVERCGWFGHIERTRIGSPFVIAAMNKAVAEQGACVVGYEANGGFLTGSEVSMEGRTLSALPTRDAVIVPLAILLMAKRAGMPISKLLQTLPQRFTASGRLKAFPTELSRSKLAALNSGDLDRDMAAATALFGDLFGKVAAIDVTDGIRMTFESGEIAHLRPSGNAPELRCYTEAGSEKRAAEMNRQCMALLESWRR